MEPLRDWIDDVDGSSLGARQLHGLGDDGGKGHSELARGCPCLRHLSYRTQVPHRLRELMTARFQLVRALLDLLFQAGVGFLQLPRHRVELVRERLELVPCLDGDALAEVAATEACSA